MLTLLPAVAARVDDANAGLLRVDAQSFVESLALDQVLRAALDRCAVPAREAGKRGPEDPERLLTTRQTERVHRALGDPLDRVTTARMSEHDDVVTKEGE